MSVDGFVGLDRDNLVDLVWSMSDDESSSFLGDYFRKLIDKRFNDGTYEVDSSGAAGYGSYLVFHELGDYLIGFVGLHGGEKYFSELEQKVTRLGFHVGVLSKEFSFYGLLREDSLWLFNPHSHVEDNSMCRDIFPSKGISRLSSFSDCSAHELMVLYLDYKNGVIAGLTKGFEYDTPLNDYLKNKISNE